MARKSGPRALSASERQSGSQLPLRFGGDPLLWAAWLYYEEGMTQGDIAVAMGEIRAGRFQLAEEPGRGKGRVEAHRLFAKLCERRLQLFHRSQADLIAEMRAQGVGGLARIDEEIGGSVRFQDGA